MAASTGSERPPAAHSFLLRNSAFFSAHQSKWAAIWWSAISRQDLDRRFRLHNMPRAVPYDQQPNERIAKAVGENRCASGLVQRRSWERHARRFAPLRTEIASRA